MWKGDFIFASRRHNISVPLNNITILIFTVSVVSSSEYRSYPLFNLWSYLLVLLPARRYASAVFTIIACPSVRLSQADIYQTG